MVKIINGLSKMILHTLLVMGLTIYLTWAAVHTYIDKLLAQYHLETGLSKVQFSDFLAQLSNNVNILKPSHVQEKASDAPELDEAANGQGANAGNLNEPTPIPSSAESATSEPDAGHQQQADSSSAITSGGADQQSANAAKEPDNSVPVFKQGNDAAEGDAQKQTKAEESILMTAEQFSHIKDQISDSDKLRIFSLLSTQLPAADLQQFTGYLESGVTEQEWKDIQAEVQKYVKAEDYQELLTILAKY